MKARAFLFPLLALALGCSVDFGGDDEPDDKPPEATGTGGTTGGDDDGDDDAGESAEGPSETSGATTTPDPGTTGEPPADGIALQPVVDGLVAPTAMAVAPDGTMVVADQTGIAYRIDTSEPQQFFDLRARIVELDPGYDERGLLGLTFHPDYPEDARVFVYYSAPARASAPEGYDHTNVLAEMTVGDNGVVDIGTERELGAIDWPQANHNGGTIAFGFDGYLYAALGDGGGAGDVGLGHPPEGNGQDIGTRHGSILRIDPVPADDGPYRIPEDNPFAGPEPGADEIWAYGLRNPASMAFDPATGELFVGDAGQDLMEEIDIVEVGQNYGWNIREGTLCFDPEDFAMPLPDCPYTGPFLAPLIDPIMTYTHPGSVVEDESEVHGLAVVGGRVYRGTTLPELDGIYVFGDWSRSFDAPEGQLFVALRTGDSWDFGPMQVAGTEADHIGMYVRGFGQDLDGEVYVLTSNRAGPEGETGAVWMLAPAE